jgi:pilus assembly protein CpaF
MATTPEISAQLYAESKNAILAYLVQNIDQKLLEKGDETLLRRRVEELVEEKLRSEKLPFSRQMRNRLVSDMADEILGFGPIEPLLRDPTVTEVMINRPDQVYCERFGKLELTDIQFRDFDHIRHVIDKIVTPLGRRVDESSPMVDARLPDGSRVNAIISPLSLNGPVLTIRKFSVDPYTVEDLIGFGTITQGMAAFLAACVKIKLNILVSGGSGAGKTTLLNVLSSFIPERRARGHCRGRGGIETAPAARRAFGIAPAQHRRQGRNQDSRSGSQLSAHAPRSDRGRRSAWRRGAGHVAGHEHRP